MAVMLGLNFDLSSWKQGVKKAGVILKRGLGGKESFAGLKKGMKSFRASARAGFGKIGGYLKGALSSAMLPLAGLLAGGAIVAGLKSVLSSSLESFRGYQDSVTKLNAALKATGETNLGAARGEVEALGESLRLAMGVGQAETNAVFGDFLTRGFDQGEAKQLTVLAANIAQKTGKPLADVQKQIADAANGGVDAMKELGIEINSTGNRVTDGTNAVLAMKAAYGDIGADLVNPSQLLNANLEQLRVMLGERISPLIEPLIQGVSDFVAGLTKTEEGREYLDGIADSFEVAWNWAGQMIVQVSNLVSMVKSGGGVIKNLIALYMNFIAKEIYTVLDEVAKTPLVSWLLGKAGIDAGPLTQVRDAFTENFQMAMDDVKASSSDFMRAQGEFMRGETDTGLLGGFNQIREAGAQVREDARADLQRQSDETRDQGFAGRPAQQAEAEKRAAADKAAAEAEAKKQEEVLKQQSARFNGAGDVNGGVSLSVKIVNKRNERFRREVR